MRWILLLLLMAAGQASADDWMYYGGAKILSITEWQGNGPIFVEMASGSYCFIPSDEKNMIALVYSLYANSKAIDVHCNPKESTVFAGMTGYRMHRIVTTRS